MRQRCIKHNEDQRGSATYRRCGKCATEWVRKHRQEKKRRLVELLGGKCQMCGYNKYIGSLDFHHVDPKKKSFGISSKGLSYSWAMMREEAKKCILLCRNCHGEVEAQEK